MWPYHLSKKQLHNYMYKKQACNQISKIQSSQQQDNQLEPQIINTQIPQCASQAKYKTSMPLEHIDFLEYYMLPEKDEFDFVYRPGDDSFFMLFVLRRQIDDWIAKYAGIDNTLHNTVIAELGSGSGIISAHVANWLKDMKQSPLIHLSIDINIDACLLSQKYYRHYNLNIEQICTSYFKNTIFSAQQCNKLIQSIQDFQPSIILFNPPYIPVQQQQVQNQRKYLHEKFLNLRQNPQQHRKRKRQQNLIAFSYMGGQDGLTITRNMLQSVYWNTWVYLIVMGEEGYRKIHKQLLDNTNFWKQYRHQYDIRANVKLMQFMKFQNQDLFLLKIQINSQKIVSQINSQKI